MLQEFASGGNAKALVWRWRQICPLKINISTLKAPVSTNKVSVFKLTIEVCFKNVFGLIHAKLSSLGSTKSVYFFLGTPGINYECLQYGIKNKSFSLLVYDLEI